MRPPEFEAFLVAALAAAGATGVRTLAEAGDEVHPFGVAYAVPSGEARWQITGQLADGERPGTPAAAVTGDPAPWAEPAPGDWPDAWIAAAVGRTHSPEVARIDRWSTRPGSRRQGVTVTFHNGRRAFVRRL